MAVVVAEGAKERWDFSEVIPRGAEGCEKKGSEGFGDGLVLVVEVEPIEGIVTPNNGITITHVFVFSDVPQKGVNGRVDDDGRVGLMCGIFLLLFFLGVVEGERKDFGWRCGRVLPSPRRFSKPQRPPPLPLLIQPLREG